MQHGIAAAWLSSMLLYNAVCDCMNAGRACRSFVYTKQQARRCRTGQRNTYLVAVPGPGLAPPLRPMMLLLPPRRNDEASISTHA